MEGTTTPHQARQFSHTVGTGLNGFLVDPLADTLSYHAVRCLEVMLSMMSKLVQNSKLYQHYAFHADLMRSTKQRLGSGGQGPLLLHHCVPAQLRVLIPCLLGHTATAQTAPYSVRSVRCTCRCTLYSGSQQVERSHAVRLRPSLATEAPVAHTCTRITHTHPFITWDITTAIRRG